MRYQRCTWARYEPFGWGNYDSERGIELPTCQLPKGGGPAKRHCPELTSWALRGAGTRDATPAAVVLALYMRYELFGWGNYGSERGIELPTCHLP